MTSQLPEIRSFHDRLNAAVEAAQSAAALRLPPDQIATALVRALVEHGEAMTMGLWLGDAQGRLRLEREVDWMRLQMRPASEAAQRHGQMIAQTIQTGQSLVVQGDSQHADLRPVPGSFVLAPLQGESQAVGVLEAVWDRELNPADRTAVLHAVEQVASLLTSLLLQPQEARAEIGTPAFWEKIEPFFQQIHRSIDLKESAAAIAFETARVTGADRVTVFRWRGGRARLLSVSGDTGINRKADLVKLAEKLAARLLPTGERFLHDGRLVDRPPPVEAALAAYLAEAGSKQILFYPLVEPPQPRREGPKPNQKDRIDPGKPVAGLMIERFQPRRVGDDEADVAALLARHASLSYVNANRHEQILLLPLWRWLGRLANWVMTTGLRKTLAAAAACAVVACVLVFVWYPYRVSCDGRLMPAIQRDVFAPWDGVVKEVRVRAGAPVKRDDVVVVIENQELTSEHLRVVGELSEKRVLARALQAEIATAGARGERTEVGRLEGQLAEAQVEIASLIKDEAVLALRLKSLTVRSPIDGVVATFQVEQLLQDRPVSRQDALLEIMDTDADWRLELLVEDRRMGALLSARAEQPDGVPVEFVLATRPEVSFEAEVVEVGTRANVHDSAGNIIFVHASIAPDQVPERRIGSEVKAKIDCGPRRLGYVLFGDVIDFVRLKLWW